MRFAIATAAVAVVLLNSSAFAAGLVPERVETAIQERIAADQYPVVVIAVVDGDKSEVRGFGKLPGGKPADGNTVFEIGSVTKTFTATLLADAVLKGTLRLDQPIADLLPGWTIPGGPKLTLETIATQRSGLPRMPTNFVPAGPANPYRDYGEDKLKAFLAGYTLPREPGTKYEYSNLGFGLLGTALAHHAQSDYASLLQRIVFGPLGMTASSVATTPSQTADLAPGHDEKGLPTNNWVFDAFAGAGGVRSTGNDMLKYLKANMTAAQGTAMALAQQPRADVGPDSKIGLAWMTTGKYGVVWHNGMTGGYAAYVGFSADRKHGVVLLTNAAASLDDLGFATLIAEAPITAVKKSVTLPVAALDEVVGDYRLPTGLVIHIFREGDQLVARAEGQPALPIYASGPNDFFVKIAPIAATFTRDAAGKVTGLVLHQNGDHVAPKVTDTAFSVDAKTLRDYVGVYSFGAHGDFVFTLKDGQLFAQLATQSAFQVYPGGKDAFFYKVVDAQLSFERDGAGKVIAVVLHQNGHDTRAPKK
jgi:serine-type D-Ala-D-Ala carboxypeptidase/endopeptidase